MTSPTAVLPVPPSTVAASRAVASVAATAGGGNAFSPGSAAVVAVFGGTGFIGRHVVRNLAAQGYIVRVVARQAARAAHLKTMGDPGQIVLMSADVTQPESLTPVLAGVRSVVNLVGILSEHGTQQFPALHAQAPEQLAKLARSSGVQRFVHVSALGVDQLVNAKYARTKAMGEKAVRSAFPEATILRPSVVFGPEDNFFNMFARMMSLSPVMPLVGGGRTRFQPVFVGDVAAAVSAALLLPEAAGGSYDLGGPEVMSLKQVAEYIARHTGRPLRSFTLPFELAQLLAFGVEWLPRPPLTRDQVRLLRGDNLVRPEARTLADLGVAATHPDDVVPAYLARYARAGFRADPDRT